MAEPEKALLDFLYFRSDLKDESDISGLRINVDIYKEIVNQDKLNEYLAIFQSPVLARKITLLNEYIQKNA